MNPRLMAGAATAVILSTSPLDAQPLGSFSWQLQPFCNNLTVNVTQQGSLFTIDGVDDQCGAGRAPGRSRCTDRARHTRRHVE